MKSTYFITIRTIEELKAEYKRLALLWHPDRSGGDLAKMQAINAEYDSMFELVKDTHFKKDSRETWTASGDWATNETAEAYRAIIYMLINIQGIQLEICGSWLWITGDTKPHKDQLKALGCLWSKNKSAWYYNGSQVKKRRAHCKNMNEVRAKWGSQTIDQDQQQPERRYVTA